MKRILTTITLLLAVGAQAETSITTRAGKGSALTHNELDANFTALKTTADGAVQGPASAVSNNVCFFNGTTGKLIKDSGLTLSGSNTGDQTITLTGDVTGSGTGSFAATIANNAVTLAKMATVATARILGRQTSGTGNVEALTGAEATALLSNVTGDSGSGGIKGLVPAPGAGDFASSKYLKADGGWAVVNVGQIGGFGSGVATWLATPTGANLVTALSSGGGTTNYLRADGAFAAPPGSGGGTGDVVGPASSTDSHVALFDGTDGKLLKDGGALATVATSGSASDLGAGTLPAARLPAHTGDATSSAGSAALTLATVNSDVGTCGSATASCAITLNAKGLATAATANTVTPAVGSVTGLGTGVAAFLATPSSANFATVLTDENGSGKVQFSAGTLAIASGKTLTASNTLTLVGTDSTTITFPSATSTLARTTGTNAYSGTQSVTAVALTDGTNIAVDGALSNNFTVTLAGARTLDNPSNLANGATYNFYVEQDGTGSRTLAFGSKYKFAGGSKTLSTAASARDLISCLYDITDDILLCVLSKAFS